MENQVIKIEIVIGSTEKKEIDVTLDINYVSYEQHRRIRKLKHLITSQKYSPGQIIDAHLSAMI